MQKINLKVLVLEPITLHAKLIIAWHVNKVKNQFVQVVMDS